MELNKTTSHSFKFVIWKTTHFLLIILIFALFYENLKYFGFFVGIFFIYTLAKVISYFFWKFNFSEKYIKVKTGILFTKTRDISFKDIQNMDITAGPLMKIIGLSKISMWTSSSKFTIKRGSGESRSDIDIFLDKENAEWLKKYILENENI